MMKEYKIDFDEREFLILVGNNASENWELIDNSDSFDLWFHIDKKPSCHVVIREKLKKELNKVDKNDKYFGYPIQIIIKAAQYCKMYSKYNTKLKIVYTTISNVRKTKEVGSVKIKNEKYIVI